MTASPFEARFVPNEAEILNPRFGQPAHEPDPDGPVLRRPERANDPFVQAIADVLPAVVRVTAERTAQGGAGFGAGVVVGRGRVVTNWHVVAGAGRVLLASLDGAACEGRVVAEDPDGDLAYVAADALAAPAAPLADGEPLVLGQAVAAIGHPIGLEWSVSRGVLSSLDREFGAPTGRPIRGLQTDAAINPGNSGGALLTEDGAVVGIPTAVLGNAHGLGFAIPAAAVRRFVALAESGGAAPRPVLGLAVQPCPLRPDLARRLGGGQEGGLLVLAVVPDRPAATAGLRPGDLLLVADGQALSSAFDLQRLFPASAVGVPVPLVLMRHGSLSTTQLVATA